MEQEDRKRILFVDDDRNVLDGLRRMLYNMRDVWKMEFVTKGLDALKAMKGEHYDVIVCDMKMPGMDGVKLLEKVQKRSPDTIRFMLTGCSDQPMRNKAIRCVHQFVTKPCQADVLSNMISRAFSLHERIKSEGPSGVISSLKSLPVMPKAYQKVIDAFNDPYCSPRTIGRMISSDIGLSAKILQVANSGFQGGAVKIVDPVRAVVHLGLKAVEALVLTSGIFSKLSESLVERFFAEGLQQHCARVGMYSRMICESFKMCEEDLETATMAGILHDTGKMVLIAQFPDEYFEVIEKSRKEGLSLFEVERESLGVTHCELGGSLLELWGLPNNIIECATYHQEIDKSFCDGAVSINGAVYLANLLDHEMLCSLGGGYLPAEDEDKLKRYNLYELWDRWKRKTVPVEYCEVLNVT